jgi:hypothetical protein
MSVKNFVVIAYALGSVLMGLLLLAGGLFNGSPAMPLLALLFVAEFGFFVTGGAAIMAFRGVKGEMLQRNRLVISASLAAFSLTFMVIGVSLWRAFVSTSGAG